MHQREINKCYFLLNIIIIKVYLKSDGVDPFARGTGGIEALKKRVSVAEQS